MEKTREQQIKEINQRLEVINQTIYSINVCEAETQGKIEMLSKFTEKESFKLNVFGLACLIPSLILTDVLAIKIIAGIALFFNGLDIYFKVKINECVKEKNNIIKSMKDSVSLYETEKEMLSSERFQLLDKKEEIENAV